MIWLQGGPFYEISLLLNNNKDKRELIADILEKLNNISFKIEVVSNEHDELKEQISNYIKGYEDNNKAYRTFDINIWVNISGKRKARLFIAELSEELIKVNFWFFGDKEDAKEWDQLGIMEKDKPTFKTFLAELATTYNAIVGTIGYEVDVDSIFNNEEGYPSNQFTSKNLSFKEIEKIIKGGYYEIAIVSSSISFNKEPFIWIENK